MRREEKPTRCYWMVYCTCNLLNMFRALNVPIIGSSRLHVYLCYYRIWCVMPWLLVVGGQVQGSMHSLLSCTWPRQYTPYAVITQVQSRAPDDGHIKCPKHVEQITSAINHSAASSWFFFSTHTQRCKDKHTSNFYLCQDIGICKFKYVQRLACKHSPRFVSYPDMTSVWPPWFERKKN